MNRILLYKVLGSLLFLEAFFMSWCLVVSFIYGEKDFIPFLLSIAITIVAGVVMRYNGKDYKGAMTRKDAYLIVTVLWLVFSLFGSLPFILGGYLPNISDAFFETISGFTTTGATVIDDVDSMPHGILFWRSLTQWIGGLGIVFFTIAFLLLLAAVCVSLPQRQQVRYVPSYIPVCLPQPNVYGVSTCCSQCYVLRCIVCSV